VAVLRDGRLVGELEGDDIKPAAMIRLMIGRDLKSLYVPPARPRDRVVLALDHVQTRTHPQRPVSLDLHGGEILGLAGLVGSGRTELARAVFGVDTLLGGTLRLMGEEIVIRSPRDAIGRGIYLVPEDRKRSSLLLDMSIAENISLPELLKYAQGLLVHAPSEAANAERQRRVLNIKAPDVSTPVASLSGGNQQKVVLAKWLSMQPRAIIFDEPTRGIDVGAKNEIYALMRRLADSGVAIMMISSDMEEVIGVSDRIAVMHEGAISGFLERERFSETNVLQLAVGHLH
jgi:ribose transport system ATP-binding protein